MIEIADAAQCTYRAWFGPTVSGCLSDWAISACRKAHNSSARAKWVHSPMRTFCSQARQGDGDVYPLVGGQWKRVVQLLFRWPTAVFTDLTPNATCGRLAKRRNPDQGEVRSSGEHSRSIFSRSGLECSRNRGCAWAEPILRGSALAFPTLGTRFKQNTPTQVGPKAAQVGIRGHQVKTSRLPWREYMIFSLYHGRVSQAVQADGIHPIAGKETCPAIPSARLPRHNVARCCGSTDQARPKGV
jgi:hypothetical protein